MAKFTPLASNYPDDFAGFWKPLDEGGTVCKGLIVSAFHGEFSKTLIVRLLEPCRVKARFNDDEVDYDAVAGDSVGVNMKAGMRGLDAYVGKVATIRHLGKKTETKGKRLISQHEFDIDIDPPTEKEKKFFDQKARKSA